VAPECRIVYVDNDPVVLAHARALLTSTPEGATAYLDADLRDPDTIVRGAARTLDFTQPIAIMLMGILGHIADDDEARSIVKRLLGGVPSGSYLAMNDGTDTSEEVVEAARIWNQSANPTYHLRSPDRIARFFDDLELVEPGVVSPHDGVPSPVCPASPPRSIRRVGCRAQAVAPAKGGSWRASATTRRRYVRPTPTDRFSSRWAARTSRTCRPFGAATSSAASSGCCGGRRTTPAQGAPRSGVLPSPSPSRLALPSTAWRCGSSSNQQLSGQRITSARRSPTTSNLALWHSV
jgi:hypothetical protein